MSGVLPNDGLVYYVLDATRREQRVKIGTTTQLRIRLQQLAAQTVTKQQPLLLALEEGGARTERERHDQFRDRRLFGEWFDYNDRDGQNDLQEWLTTDLESPYAYIYDRPELWRYATGTLGIPPMDWQPLVPRPEPTWPVEF